MPPTATPNLPWRLRLEDLAVTFRRADGSRNPVIHSASLTLHSGQTLALVGESGSGKSLTAMSLLALTPPNAFRTGTALLQRSSGDIIDLFQAPPAQLRRIRGGDIAMIFQEPMSSLNPVMTVGEQIAEAVRLHTAHSNSKSIRATVIDAMQAVGIASAAERICQYPHQFSGGMRQRVMIAAALACNTSILIADEPTTALDVSLQAEILELINTQRSLRGMSVLFITHDLHLAAQHAQRMCVMYAGRTIESAPTATLFSRPAHPYTRALLACHPSRTPRGTLLPTVPQLMALDAGGHTVRLADGRQGQLVANHIANSIILIIAGRQRNGHPSVQLARVGDDHDIAIWSDQSAEVLGEPLTSST